MKNCPKNGLTLVEMLIVVAIFMVLVSMTIGIAVRLDNQGKQRLTQNTIALLNMALKQFADYGYQYRTRTYNMINTTTPEGQAERDFYDGLDFPPDCNGYEIDRFRYELAKLQDLRSVAGVLIVPDTAYDPAYSGCSAMYFFLSLVPQCRATLERIDSSLLIDTDENKQPMQLLVNNELYNELYSLTRVVDPWGETLRYDYYHETVGFLSDERQISKRNFPVITSAGPDGKFDTHDDITGIY